jgi:hypothetical protein
MLVERIGMGGDLDPFAAAGDHREDSTSRCHHPHIVLQLRSTRHAFLDHERSKAELKALMPEDAKEAIGHGVRAKRSKSGAVSFDLLEPEGNHAAV